MRHRPKGCTKIRSANHSNRPENGEARDRQQARYRLQTDIEAQICAEQKHRKAIERHRKETPQRALSQQRRKSLGAKTGNRQSPTIGKAPQQQCPQQESQSPTPDNEETSPSKGRKQNPPIATKPLPLSIRAHRIFKSIVVHNNSLTKGHF